jgi:hypothetical protein
VVFDYPSRNKRQAMHMQMGNWPPGEGTWREEQKDLNHLEAVTSAIANEQLESKQKYKTVLKTCMYAWGMKESTT